jgi:diguanylate cyclase (GGDEF)-like protein
VLQEVGEVLLTRIRQVDSAFRYGGDEFAVMLIETDLKGARAIGERILDGFRTRRFQRHRGLNLELTASLGIAVVPEHGRNAYDLIQAADAAMYRVKAAGRNGVGE